MTEALELPRIHRSTLEKCGCPTGFEQWLVENRRAVIVEDVVPDGHKRN